MLAYPVRLEPDGDAVMAASPDFPELTTFGDNRKDALTHAVDALEEAIAARIHASQDIPAPSQGRTRVALPTLTAVKVVLYQGMRGKGISRADLGRRLGWTSTQVDRVLDIQHRSRLDHIDAALGVIGQRLEVSASPTPPTGRRRSRGGGRRATRRDAA